MNTAQSHCLLPSAFSRGHTGRDWCTEQSVHDVRASSSQRLTASTAVLCPLPPLAPAHQSLYTPRPKLSGQRGRGSPGGQEAGAVLPVRRTAARSTVRRRGVGRPPPRWLGHRPRLTVPGPQIRTSPHSSVQKQGGGVRGRKPGKQRAQRAAAPREKQQE